MDLSITTTTDSDATRLHVVGEVDVSCANELRDALDAAFAKKPASIDVDLAQVSYIDSTGIGVLVGAAHRAFDGSMGFSVSNPQSGVSRVLGLLGVDAELNVRSDG